MITFMHWIRRQPLLPSIRVFDVIRLVPYLRSFNGTSTARPTLTPELSQSGRTRKISSSTQQTTSQRERSLITRNEIIGETSERPSSFKHRDVNRQASVEVMESSTQTTDSPSIHRRRCGEESDLSCASNPPPWWNGVCRSKRDLSRPCRGSSSLCPEPCNSYLDDHYKANFCGEDITGTTPITDAARVGQSDDSWRELRELIDQAVNRTRWAPSACTCCGSQHVAPSRAFVSSQSQTEDERLIAPAALGFPQMDTIPSANVLDTLLSWNSIWSNVESDNVLHSASCLSPSSAPGAFESATSQPWANDSLKGVTHSKIRWAPSVQVGQGGANHNSGPLNVPVQSCPTPIGSLRHRRIEDRIQPSIWSPTWQPSSSDPEFAVTSSLMLYSSAEGRFNERPFPTFLRNTVNGLSEGNICTNRRAPVQNDMGSAIIQESNFSLPEINRPSILAVAGSSKSTLPAARISSAASKTS
ncbi:hypothetical protein BIW11_06790 [Tropilaelaps mercedesae]|uniref:Uncharacterized protein n=1 Tax=Tropilaelaps mercedesae TaxID=418985 RepID=A0A1V9XWS1_9ACAR|nr:hypothetical protein BIW11_06790 [Tropilaelaps mercedesae]